MRSAVVLLDGRMLLRPRTYRTLGGSFVRAGLPSFIGDSQPSGWERLCNVPVVPRRLAVSTSTYSKTTMPLLSMPTPSSVSATAGSMLLVCSQLASSAYGMTTSPPSEY